MQPAALAGGVRRTVMDRMRRIDADLARGKCWLIGMHSLTWLEKRALRKATERQRMAELSRPKRGF